LPPENLPPILICRPQRFAAHNDSPPVSIRRSQRFAAGINSPPTTICRRDQFAAGVDLPPILNKAFQEASMASDEDTGWVDPLGSDEEEEEPRAYQVRLEEDLELKWHNSEREEKTKPEYGGALFTIDKSSKDKTMLFYRCDVRSCKCRLKLMADSKKLRYVAGAHSCPAAPWKASNAEIKDKRDEMLKLNPDAVSS
jgi:hypothetical protein